MQTPGGGSPEPAGARHGEARAVDEGAARVPIEDALDLHAFAPRDVRSVVAEYLEQARARGFTEVRLIHGRGTGVQRESVRAVLAAHPAVAGYAAAPPERGGWGATIVWLKR